MVRGGYGQITDAMAAALDVRRGHPVAAILAGENSVTVRLRSGAAFDLHEYNVKRLTYYLV